MQEINHHFGFNSGVVTVSSLSELMLPGGSNTIDSILDSHHRPCLRATQLFSLSPPARPASEVQPREQRERFVYLQLGNEPDFEPATPDVHEHLL
ncbi:hypothetical protein V6N13_108554 [Hibiscus sabdariffa]